MTAALLAALALAMLCLYLTERKTPVYTAMTLLCAVVRRDCALPALQTVRGRSRELAVALHRIRRTAYFRHAHDGQAARNNGLCDMLLQPSARLTAEGILDGLRTWQKTARLTLAQREALPLALQAQLMKRLIPLLRDVYRDTDDWYDGMHLADRLMTTRKPLRLLLRQRMSAACLSGTVHRLREKERHELLAALDGLMHEAGLSMTRMQERHMHRQAVLADAVDSIAGSIIFLQQLDWDTLEESADPLHEALSADPSGVYTQMTAASRTSYRRETARLARLFHADEIRVARAALSLAREAQDDPPRHHVGYWLLVPQGMSALRERLGTRRGRMTVIIRMHRTSVAAAMAGIDCAVWTMLYLTLGMPVVAALGGSVMLTAPVRMLMLRFLDRIVPEAPLPVMEVEDIGDDRRTLVVLPAELGSSGDALACIRQLALAQHALGGEAVDYLLLGDYTANQTLQASRDRDVCAAATAAATALADDGRRVMYMQRSRVWQPSRRCFAGDGGVNGLTLALVHLLADGSADSVFECATVPPGELYRQYAYVLILPQGAKAFPGMLHRAIGMTEHPLLAYRDDERSHAGCGMLLLHSLTDAADDSSLLAQLASPNTAESGVFFRPDAFAADTSLIDAAAPLTAAAQQLAGAVSAGDACMLSPAVGSYRADAAARWQHVYDLFRSTSWILSRSSCMVHARYASAFLRTSLWRTLTPVAAMLAVVSAVLLRSYEPLLPVIVAALLGWLTERTKPLRALLEAVMLPFHAVLHAHAAWRGLRDAIREKPAQKADALFSDRRFALTVCWSQGLAAALSALLALTKSPPSWSGIAAAAVFACFMWLPERLNQPPKYEHMPDASDRRTLADALQATWRWFEAAVSESTHHLPPAREQIDPPRGADMTVTPDAAAMYLLSIVSACEMQLISPDEAADRIAGAANTLGMLQTPEGLFFDRYDMATLEPTDPRFLSAESNGMMCAALMTAAQMLRAKLAQIRPQHHRLPAVLDDLSGSMQLQHLMSRESGLFSAKKDGDGHACGGMLPWYASSALLLCFIAMMCGEASADMLTRLDRTMVRSGLHSVMLSPEGSIVDYALPALFLPCRRRSRWGKTVRRAMVMHVAVSRQGIFGLSRAASDAFDITLRSKQEPFGLDTLAAQSGVRQHVFAPYAAALSLPWTGKAAADCLRRMQAAAMFGPQGFFDSITVRSGGMQPVQAYDAAHQGLFMCAVAEALCGAISRNFMKLPAAEAWTPVLHRPLSSPAVLPKLLVTAQSSASPSPEVMRGASALMLPADAAVFGSGGASALVTADGMTVMRGEGLYWTAFSGEALEPEGLRICVSDGRRTVHIGDGSRTVFGEGHASFTQMLGPLQLRMTAVCDPVTQTIWHLVHVANTAPTAREVTICDVLTPSVRADGSTDESAAVDRPDDRTLLTGSDANGGRLCHTVCADAPCQITSFANRSSAPKEASSVLSVPDACMGFSCRILLDGGEHATAAFATSLIHGGTPAHMRSVPMEAPLLSVARIYSRIQTEHIDTTPEMALRALCLTGALLWHGLPHQGASEPLHVSAQELCAFGADVHMPFLLLSLHSDDFLPVLDDALICAALLCMRGWPIGLVILCRTSVESDVRLALDRTPPACRSGMPLTVLTEEQLPEGVRSALEGAARLILFDGCDALAQLRQGIIRLQPHAGFTLPAPDAEPVSGLLHADASGGFDSASLAYVQLASPEGAPKGWARTVSDGRIGMRVSAEGILGTFAGPLLHMQLTDREIMFLQEDGMRISPCTYPYGSGCVIRMHHRPGTAVWDASCAGLAMTLTCAPVSGCDAGLRIWRLHNKSDRARTLTLHFGARFLMGDAVGAMTHITTLGGTAVASSPSSRLYGFMAAADEGCETLVMSSGSFRAMLGFNGAYAEAEHEGLGCAVLMRRQMTLAPDEAFEAAFAVGTARTADDIEHVLEHVRHRGAAALADEAQNVMLQKLNRITFETPDEAFNLLMNRLLPAFLLTPQPGQTAFTHVLAAAPFVLCGGHVMRSALLHASEPPPASVHERILLPLLTAWYVSRTHDESILHEPIPSTDDTRRHRSTLLMHMMQLLTGVKLSPDGLPSVHDRSDLVAGLQYVAALHAFQPYMPEDNMQDAARMADMVTAAAQRALADDRTCLAACWAVFAGLFGSLPPDCEPADFSETIPYLHALCLTRQHDDAWALIGWLNPALHHDALTPPWQPEPDGTSMASAWMYISIAEQLLGVEKRGDTLRMQPHLPENWDACTVSLQYGSARYHVTLTDEVRLVQLDGVIRDGDSITLTDDGLEHHVKWPLNRR